MVRWPSCGRLPAGTPERVNVAAFDGLRPLLFSVAYRLLGQAADADDAVQEAWLRYLLAGETIDDPRAWLLRVTTRLCLDQLRSARARRERYVGPWLPEPVMTGSGHDSEDPFARVERREQLSLGAVALLEKLSPTQRAVFVLREGLDLAHAEIARTVGVSEVGSRQLLARARRRLVEEPGHWPAPAEAQREFISALEAAFDSGDPGPLIARLRDDIILVSDGGGEVPAAVKPIHGRDKVLRFMVGVRGKVQAGARLAVANVNGEPALVLDVAELPTGIIAVVLDEAGDVVRLLLINAPSKLSYLRRQRASLS